MAFGSSPFRFEPRSQNIMPPSLFADELPDQLIVTVVGFVPLVGLIDPVVQ